MGELFAHAKKRHENSTFFCRPTPKETAMYKNISDAHEASKRLQLRFGMDIESADRLVLAFAGAPSWKAMEDNARAPRNDELENYNLASSFHEYLRNNENPFIKDGYNYVMSPPHIEQFLLPMVHDDVDEEDAPDLLEYAQEVLAQQKAKPAWVKVNAVRRQPNGDISVAFPNRHRDGIRYGTDVFTVNVEALGDDEKEAINTVISKYVEEHPDGIQEAPYTNEDVHQGAADHLYGVDEVTLRWARQHYSGDVRQFLRAIIMEQYGCQMGYSDADGTPSLPYPENQLAETSIEDAKANRYVAHLSRNIVRRIMSLDKTAVWDRALHLSLSLPESLKPGLEDIDIKRIVDHPYFQGLKAKRMFETKGSFGESFTVIETTSRCISLDSCHLPEESWKEVSIIQHPEITKAAVIDECIDEVGQQTSYTVKDCAFVNGAFYAVGTVSGRSEILIMLPGSKVRTEGDDPFAASCPERLLAQVPSREFEWPWRIRCLGLGDRTDDTSYFV